MFNLNDHEYYTSMTISAHDYPFYALIAAAMRQADTDNLERLKAAFPGMWESLCEWREKPVWPIG
jgi:hypothetical protein